ncbi:MAG: hypothetical protein OHK0013_28540 [Sandaracinaceae bacterium]
MMSQENRDGARRARALRAAKVVAMGAVVASVSGCYATGSNEDAGPRADVFVPQDASCSFLTPPTTQAGCESCAYLWDPATGTCIVAVPGPFVPPAMA